MAFGVWPTPHQPIDRAIPIKSSSPSELCHPITSDHLLATSCQLSSTHIKMKAIPQKPGPHGSRVIKKRTSFPRLGDGLANLLSMNSSSANDPGISDTGDKPSACGGNQIGNHVRASHSNATTPIVKSRKRAAISPEKEDVELKAKFTSNPDPLELNCTRFNAVLEASVPEENVSITDRFESELCRTNAGKNVVVSMDSSLESVSHVSLVYESSFTSSDDTPLDYMSTTSGDGVRLPSSNSTPCTPYDDFDEQSIELPAKAENGQLHDMFEAGVDHASQRQPAHNLMNMRSDSTKTTYCTAPKHGFYDYSAGKPPTSIHNITMDFDHHSINTQCPVPNSYEAPQNVTLDTETADLMKTEAKLLNSYEKGEITLPGAKRIAKRNQLWSLFATLEERENRSAAAFGMPTLSQCEEKMDEVTRRHADPVGLGQNIVPPSISYPCPKWSDLKSSPTYLPKSTLLSVEEIKLVGFLGKLSIISSPDTHTSTQKPVHVFVDMSNIFIGFCDSWKISQGIPVQQFIKAPAFNFKVFSSIMQRRRDITKRILAGSVGGGANERNRWPRHLIEASESGYEMNIFNRVQKPSPGSKSKRRGKTPPQAGTAYSLTELGITSGDESPEDTCLPKVGTKNGEQGVDENLHLNMMNSMVDCIEPETMVLATGDAAQAEFSGGFMQYATRALDRGWDLELITWKKTISSAWTTPAFLEKYSRQFRIIFLDDFLNELNADILPCLTKGFES